MSNPNYLAGRRFEYRVMKELRDMGFTAMRTAGSHGPADIIAVPDDGDVVMMIQCKRVGTHTGLRNMAAKMKSFFPKSHHYTQYMAIGLLGDKLTRWYRV